MIDAFGSLCLVTWIIYTIATIPTFFFLYLNKNRQPVKAKSSILIALSSLAAYIMASVYCWSAVVGEENVPCFIVLWNTWAVYPFYFLPYLIRSARLLFVVLLNKAKNVHTTVSNSSSRKNTLREKENYHSKLSNHRHRFKDTYLLKIQLLLTIPFILYGIFEQIFFQEQWALGNYGCSFTFKYYIIGLVLIIFYIVFLLVNTIIMKDVQDAFSINTELRIVCVTWTLMVIPYMLINLIDKITGNSTNFPTLLLLLIMVIVTESLTTKYAVYKTFKRYVTPEQTSNYDTLEKCLNTVAGHKTFAKFLNSEFSIENLLFYEDVNSYKEIEDHLSRETMASTIRSKYFVQGALLEINIAAVLKQSVEDSIDANNITPELYDATQNSIFSLMKSDSFHRFICSSLYQELVSGKSDPNPVVSGFFSVEP